MRTKHTGRMAIDEVVDGHGPFADGRHERRRNSRTRIIYATMELIRNGELYPNAAMVAERAQVGLRSVFRHFKDKESLRLEINQILMEAYVPILRAPYRSSTKSEQLEELIERRCDIFEDIAPFCIAAWSARHTPQSAMVHFERLHERGKLMLDALLPDEVKTDTRHGRAIMIATSFNTWRLLRQDECLSQQQTLLTVKQMVEDILDRARATPDANGA